MLAQLAMLRRLTELVQTFLDWLLYDVFCKVVVISMMQFCQLEDLFRSIMSH